MLLTGDGNCVVAVTAGVGTGTGFRLAVCAVVGASVDGTVLAVCAAGMNAGCG